MGSNENRLRLLHAGVITLLAIIVIARVLLPAMRAPTFGIEGDSATGGWSSDFAAHLTFAKAFWSEGAGYDVASHVRITSEYVGRNVAHVLPFGYSPTMLWVLGPFTLVPPSWAFAAWSVLGIAAAWYMVHASGSLWVAAAFLSPLSFFCFNIGQTALFTSAAMVFLALRDQKTHRQIGHSFRNLPGMETLTLLALTAKPPLALAAAVALGGNGRWKIVGATAAAALIASALLTPALGGGWPRDYLYLLTHYDLDTAAPAFTWSLAPETMGNLRALLHVNLGMTDSIASRASSLIWLLSIVGILAGRLKGFLSSPATWSASILAYLLFCPHVTATEELHLILPMFFLVCAIGPGRGRTHLLAVALTLCVLYLAPGLLYAGTGRIALVFAAKILLVGMTLTYRRAVLCTTDAPSRNL